MSILSRLMDTMRLNDDDDDDDYLPPCGICRQVLAEFCNLNTFEVILANSEQDYRIMTLAELLPGAFLSENLKPGIF